jgi:hypothetical protein
MAEIMARIMYIVSRKGMRLAVMMMDDVEEMVMCPLKLVICTPYCASRKTAHRSEMPAISFLAN